VKSFCSSRKKKAPQGSGVGGRKLRAVSCFLARVRNVKGKKVEGVTGGAAELSWPGRYK